MFIDSHAHIYLEQFEKDRQEIISRSVDEGVERIYMPNVDLETIDAMMESEHDHPDVCLPMMGLHPCSVTRHFEKDLYVIENWLGKRAFAAVGEIGTDLYWDKSYWPQQQEALRIQLQWGLDYELPVVLHSRDSIDETIELVTPYAEQGLKGVFHCFTGTVEQAEKITKMNFMLGFGGVATFKNGGLDKVLDNVDPSHLLLETDSPYLAPVPHRGKRNEPAYIPLIAKKLAEFTGLDPEELGRVTSQNAITLFNELRED